MPALFFCILWKLQYELPEFDEALIDKDEWSIFRYRAFMSLADETWKTVTMAEGIAIGQPMRGVEILEKIYKYDMEIVEIPEEMILPARAALAAKGIYCEHTTAGNYAAYQKYCQLHGRTPDSLITMCGAELKSDH